MDRPESEATPDGVPLELGEVRQERILSKHALDERRAVRGALLRLGWSSDPTLCSSWNDIVDRIFQLDGEPVLLQQTCLPDRPFWLPPRRRYEQSQDEYKALSDVEFRKYRDRQLAIWDGMNADNPVPPARRHRGPGKTRRNATLENRYEWAALALIGRTPLEIATIYQPRRPLEFESTVRKSIEDTLSLAELDGVRRRLAKLSRRK